MPGTGAKPNHKDGHVTSEKDAHMGRMCCADGLVTKSCVTVDPDGAGAARVELRVGSRLLPPGRHRIEAHPRLSPEVPLVPCLLPSSSIEVDVAA